MTGIFELVEPSRGAFEFRLVSGTGKVLAVSGTYRDKDSAVAAMRLARQCAATALVQDHTTGPPQPPTPSKAKSGRGQGAPSRWFG
ncbi:YegP family protein [Arthrobacter gyeryongensis]|uniref:YegP family protein n=1 Tax=Arthrobacter gyeryongensis TaxID=1650592 RepID=UPI003CD06ECE